MQYTKNLNLKKPDQNDYVNIADINENMDALDESVQKKYEKPTTGISKTDLSQPVQDSLQKADNAATQTELDQTNEALAIHQADNAKHGVIGVATGTNTLVMTNSDVTAYTDMMLVAFKNTTASTGTTTLNINGLGAKAIVKANGNAVTNLKANAIYQVRYNGSNFYLLGEGGEYGTATASDVVVGKTFGTDDGVVTGTYNGKKWTSGTILNIAGGATHTISSLTFKPSTVITSYTRSSGASFQMCGRALINAVETGVGYHNNGIDPISFTDDGFVLRNQTNGASGLAQTTHWIAYE